MILIVFPFSEDKGIKVVKASLEKLSKKKKKQKGPTFFEQLAVGKTKSEKARTDKILAKCRKFYQKGKRIDAVVLVKSSLEKKESVKISYVPKELSENLAEFLEAQKQSRAKFKPAIFELNKTDFPIKLKELATFSNLTFLIEFSFDKNKQDDYDLRKYRRKKSSPELLSALRGLKKLLKNLEAHAKKKAAAVSRKHSREVSEKSSSLKGLEKQLVSEKKEIDAIQNSAEREPKLAEWRKKGEEQLFAVFKKVVWPKLAERSTYTLELAETVDAAGKNLAIKIPGRTVADVFLSGTGKLEILRRGPIEKTLLIQFYEKLCKGTLAKQWKEKLGIKR